MPVKNVNMETDDSADCCEGSPPSAWLDRCREENAAEVFGTSNTVIAVVLQTGGGDRPVDMQSSRSWH
ncbi:hypothetical protein VZT92_011266 [Zoarces viviparus]|uniref:Uncharacterized protein n=1 Tax=Zoarces viviparus TaxID=48416 RepID=A0AAW1FBH7_ZOAVI